MTFCLGNLQCFCWLDVNYLPTFVASWGTASFSWCGGPLRRAESRPTNCSMPALCLPYLVLVLRVLCQLKNALLRTDRSAWLLLGNILHVCFLWFSGRNPNPLNCQKLWCCSPSVNQERCAEIPPPPRAWPAAIGRGIERKPRRSIQPIRRGT